MRLLVVVLAVSSFAFAVAACGDGEPRTADDAGADATVPSCERAPTRDAFCAEGDSHEAFTCPTNGEGAGTALLVPRTPDGCGDPNPTADRFVAVICCP